MRHAWCFILLTAALFISAGAFANEKKPKFRVLAIHESGGWHIEYSRAARVWLDQLAVENDFAIDYIHTTDSINEAFLDRYAVFVQLDYPPYGWKPQATEAFQKYIEQGKGGWIGFHHATLLGEFDGYPMWQWFSDFMGGIRYENYIATFVQAEIKIEDRKHPVMKGVPSPFVIRKDEFYVYNKSPRPNVQVIATVDESTYTPPSKVTMGDHPVIWSNEKMKARNVYIFMGHSPDLFRNTAYTTLFSNAILWASGK